MNKEQKITIFIVILTAFITTFTGGALNIAIPDISSEFGTSAGLSGWIITVYTLTVAAASIPSGRTADITGRKKVLVAGLMLFCTSSVVSAASFSIWTLIISRGIQGIGAAMIFSTNTAILAGAFPESVRGKVLGYSLAATYAGLSAGPFLGGVLNYNLGWRSIFVLPVAVSFAALIASLKKLGKEKPGKQESGPVIYKDKRAYICSSAAALVNYGSTFIVTYLLSVYFQVVSGFSSQTAGMILLVQPVIIAVLSPVTGKISDTVSPFRLAAAGMAVCAAGIAGGLLLGKYDSQLWIVISILAVVGAGSALFSSPNNNAVMSCVGKKDYGFASSVLATMRALGNTLGMLLITAVSNIYIGDNVLKQAPPEMVLKTTVIVMTISAAACAGGIFLAVVKKKHNK